MSEGTEVQIDGLPLCRAREKAGGRCVSVEGGEEGRERDGEMKRERRDRYS
eukprot:COSAG06_NODE_1821_length_8290_cov_33.022586_6_plen_51_part_00